MYRDGQFLFRLSQSETFFETDLPSLTSLIIFRVLDYSLYKSFSNLILTLERMTISRLWWHSESVIKSLHLSLQNHRIKNCPSLAWCINVCKERGVGKVCSSFRKDDIGVHFLTDFFCKQFHLNISQGDSLKSRLLGLNFHILRRLFIILVWKKYYLLPWSCQCTEGSPSSGTSACSHPTPGTQPLF